MRIQELDLKNFRGFTDFKVQFSPQFTVIAGINGQGKTAILEALALLISRLLPQISPAKLGYRNFEVSDIHGDEDGTSLLMKTNCAGIPVRYPGSFERIIPRQNFPKLPTRLQTEIRNAYGIDRTRSNDAAPIAVYYTTDRAGFSRPRNLSGKIQRGQAAAYHRALVKKQVNYKDFMQRYRVLAADAGAENPYFIGRRGVDVIERALQIFLDGFSNLRVAENPPRLMVDKGRTPLDLAQLSDGQRSVLAMVSDLCKRLCQANPQIDPLTGEGVVLIDELELHLHPTWQREIIEKFRRTFPRIQFITTTHSPFVIQSLRPGELVNLEPGEFELPQAVPLSDAPTAPALNDYLAKRPRVPTRAIVPTPDTNLRKAFLQAVNNLKQEGADLRHPKFGQLIYEMDNSTA
jgi:predicted ATP-binding protein involved in virulence